MDKCSISAYGFRTRTWSQSHMDTTISAHPYGAMDHNAYMEVQCKACAHMDNLYGIAHMQSIYVSVDLHMNFEYDVHVADYELGLRSSNRLYNVKLSESSLTNALFLKVRSSALTLNGRLGLGACQFSTLRIKRSTNRMRAHFTGLTHASEFRHENENYFKHDTNKFIDQPDDWRSKNMSAFCFL